MNQVFRIAILCAFAFSGCLSSRNAEVMIDTNAKTKKGVYDTDYQPSTPASEMRGPQSHGHRTPVRLGPVGPTGQVACCLLARLKAFPPIWRQPLAGVCTGFVPSTFRRDVDTNASNA